MKLSDEQMAKIKDVKSPEEIVAIAKENDLDLTIEEAKKYFDTLQTKQGKVSDDELDNVVGGTCYSKGKGVVDPYWGQQRRYAIVSPLNACPLPYCSHHTMLCMDCSRSFRKGATWYCAERWWENGHEERRKSF